MFTIDAALKLRPRWINEYVVPVRTADLIGIHWFRDTGDSFRFTVEPDNRYSRGALSFTSLGELGSLAHNTRDSLSRFGCLLKMFERTRVATKFTEICFLNTLTRWSPRHPYLDDSRVFIGADFNFEARKDVIAFSRKMTVFDSKLFLSYFNKKLNYQTMMW